MWLHAQTGVYEAEGEDRRLDPFAESMVDGIIAGSLSVSVVSGQLLTDKRCGTFVEVDMYGLPADTVRKKFRTRVVPNNSINPVYGDEPFVFKKVVLPELAMLRVAAHEEGGRLLGHRVLPVPGLRPGLRHVGLRTELGLPLAATLLLHIKVTDYVPDKLSELAEALANPIKYQNEMEKRTYQLSVLTDDAEEMTAPDIPKPAPAVTLTQPQPDSLPPEGSPNKTQPATDCKHNDELPQPLDKTSKAEETETKWNGTNTEISAEDTLNALFNSKVVKDKRSELARKLDALRRKQTRNKPAAKFFVKRISIKNMGDNSVVSEEGNPGVSSGGGEERELRLRYHHQIYAALEKNLRNQHQQQMKALTDLLDSEKKEILNRLANSRKEDVKALAKETIRDKDEILRRKREIHTLSVQRGVTECSRLELAHMQRRELLMLAHERLTAMLQRYREQELSELEQLCGGAPEG
ncbi:1-phosphatidylinositol 4,5-bisphosphate phosphodiesterase classes I and II isoform X2 [Leptidea sinapis]|uniref:1-phosphatidylinositol 4,5-bisphosphate phosphodiesterase classes I and II isoform X2 n=1 Tax=Leptidea sinapis TaxID=189913 RepID=UPI0021C33783|nr:1-phosphatidylinositol 4,5-bisphosphate phosphodiesterase classes I and II isoform X2 [Leptidea sinapis]